jgi:hypothetical protein
VLITVPQGERGGCNLKTSSCNHCTYHMMYCMCRSS